MGVVTMTWPITYYDRGGIRVTTQELVVQGKHYPMAELANIGITRGSTSRTTTSCATGACLFLVLASCSWQVHGTPMTASVVVTVVAALCLLATLVSHRVNPRAYEMWAVYRNHKVQLLWSRDARTFNQIKMAIVRALQASR